MRLPPFESVLIAHGADVRRYLVAGVGPQEADDCYQEVVLAALRGYAALSNAANLRGWLFRIAYTKSIDSHRGRSRRAVSVSSRHAPAGHVDEVGHGADHEIWIAVRHLPPKQRAAVLHRYLHDLAYREIGSIIGCSEAAARQNVRAGLDALRKEIEP